MKKTSYFLAIMITAGLIITTTLSGLSSNDKKNVTASQKQPSVAKQTTESAWLNPKNFPGMQQNHCPFYIVVKPGC